MNIRGEITRLRGLAALVIIGISPVVTLGQLVNQSDQLAQQLLANKLAALGEDMDLKEASFSNYKGGGKVFNANDNNSFISNTTYHSNVYDYCEDWAGRYCREWMRPYITPHGKFADHSPLEGEVYTAWQNSNKDGAIALTGGLTQYGIWNIQAEGGNSFLKPDGTLDRERITDWKLTNNVKGRIEKVGTDTANRQIARSFENAKDGKNPNIMPNMESLRMMAAHWTQMMRNHFVSALGEIRAMQPGVEVALNEDTPDCKDYPNALRENGDRLGIEERLDAQPVLDPRTRKTLEQRVALCQQMRNMSIYAVNPQVQGDRVNPGPKEKEWYDAAMMRANLAAIDYAGLDPRGKVPIDERIKIKDNDLKQEIGDYEVGGKTMRKKNETNREQIDSYNKALDSAAVGYKEVASRSYFVQDRSAQTVKSKIAVGAMSLVKLNDITPQMRRDLAGTGHPQALGSNKPDPGDNGIVQPSQLVVRKK